MNGSAPHGFEDLEALLAQPRVDGTCVVALGAGAPLEGAGLRVGDVVTHVDGTAVDRVNAWARAMRPADESDAGPRRLSVLRGDRLVELEAPPGLAGAVVCLVSRDRPAWESLQDTRYRPVLEQYLRDGTWWFRNLLGEEPAGFERVRWRREGDLLFVDTLFRIGGVSEEGATWDYCTRTEGMHLLDHTLSLVRTSFWEGAPGVEAQVGHAARGDDGTWRGVRGGKDVSFTAPAAGINTGYHAWLLTTTMPLEEGATLTWLSAGDGSGRPSSRARFRCTGRRTVAGIDGEVEAWTFPWRSYGAHPPEHDVQIHVDDGRRPVRIDWGPDYGHCVSLLTTRERALQGLPAHVKAD